ncbi:hypothetical protein DFH94DRAFT_62880 [Russula ochroleuca]|jgi:hypothetical protein|uniref:Uncharacterized protein n=1 Tax=Russula ochroleuca TaxID=152965 RepID=A0A9P5MTQ7_9AGAM|nr:hypothetical protein DFH94DRAFT_62880 [Russula ochroleuca]
MSTAQSSVWERKEAGEEAQYARQKEQEQLASLAQSEAKTDQAEPPSCVPREDRDYEAGFGGQEDLEDRYATTSGEH